MINARKNLSSLILGIIVVMLTSSAIAADKPGRDQSRRLQQQLRAVERQKADLIQKVVEAENQLKDVQAKSEESNRMANEASGRAARLSRDIDALRSQAAANKADRDALAEKLAEMERKLADLKLTFAGEKQQLEITSARQRTALADCAERNARMYQLGNELLDKYENKSCFSSVLQAEPFTGLKRAQIETMIEKDQEKLDKDQLNPGKTADANQK